MWVGGRFYWLLFHLKWTALAGNQETKVKLKTTTSRTHVPRPHHPVWGFVVYILWLISSPWHFYCRCFATISDTECWGTSLIAVPRPYKWSTILYSLPSYPHKTFVSRDSNSCSQVLSTTAKRWQQCRFMHGWMNEHNVVQSTVEYFSAIKRKEALTWYSVDESWKHLAWLEKSDHILYDSMYMKSQNG